MVSDRWRGAPTSPIEGRRLPCYSEGMRLPQFDDDGLEIERFARMSPEQLLALFLELCDLTDSIQRGRPDVHHLRRGAPVSA
jgi:hypothetical protein